MTGSVLLFVASGVFAYAVDGVLVGALVGALRLRSGGPSLNRRLLLGLVVLFAALDLYWIPAILALDLTFKIGNPKAAAVLGSEFEGAEMITFGWFEIVVWVIQGLVAVWIADRLSRPRAI